MNAVITPQYLADREFITNFVREHIGRMSARECAEALGAKGYKVTRNAVIGIAHRAKIKMQSPQKAVKVKAPKVKPQAIRPRRASGQFEASLAAAMPEKKLVNAFSVAKAPANPVSFYELKGSQCRWPLGEFAARPPYLFCGDPAFVGCYCITHYQQSIQGPRRPNNAGTEVGAGA
jgi:hypothetical protein